MNWIKVNEERSNLPESYSDVLVTYKPADLDTALTALAWRDRDETWRNSISNIRFDEDVEIIAWQPIPNAYSGDSEQLLSSKIHDIIESEVEIEEVPYGNGDVHKSQKSIEAAVKAIIKCIANH